MSSGPAIDERLADRIREWREVTAASPALRPDDVEELEDHLREHLRELSAAGLSDDEAFLIGVTRVGRLSDLSDEFAREHSDRLWKQLVLQPSAVAASGDSRPDVMVMAALAIGAALAVHLPRLFFGTRVPDLLLVRNISFLVLPFLAGYFAWKHQLALKTVAGLGGLFAGAAAVTNIHPYAAGSDTEVLVALHVPIALWLVTGVAYAGGDWRTDARRMDFVRFTGEWLIYYVLIALGGGVLVGLTAAVFNAVGIPVETLMIEWLVPSAAAGAVVVAAWLVDEKKGVIENIAPVLTLVFSPLFTLVLVALLVAMVATGNLIDVDRTVLIIFDLLLVVVLGLILYALSAREPGATPTRFDLLQWVLVVSALIVDLLVLAAIVARISEFGFSANKAAALGENLVLLVNLAWAGWLTLGFLRGRTPITTLERWQTRYLGVYAVWAALVVIAFPPLFGYR